ncbi:MAG: precorrin-8X methylmutase [Desulfobacterales bacterium]|jgi:precorrin isomerase|nr:precorrin-8X methylmutase [Desulfobacterales bacterium]
MTRRARIHQLLAHPLNGQDIETLSFAAIDRDAPPHSFSPDQWKIVRRMIHTTGDFSIMKAVQFSADAIRAGVAALRAGRPLYVDTNMIRAGLSLDRLCKVCEPYDPSRIHCHVADTDIIQDAMRMNLPRSVVAIRKARHLFINGAIAVFGNAPTALFELNRMIIEEGAKPALVIAAPVGFIHVEESKEELAALNVPHIILSGTRGGSPIAVSIVHALCSLAASAQPKTTSEARAMHAFDAVMLLGHGSRVPGADESMLRVADTLKKTGRYHQVETCNMSRLGPHFEEVFEKCVHHGARSVLLLPYFLNQGLHMKLDIPEKMQTAVQQYPHVKLVFGKNLGYDPLLVRLVEKRIAESVNLGDVREIQLPDENTYPVPRGQCEFVPMLPEEATQWKRVRGTIENQ